MCDKWMCLLHVYVCISLVSCCQLNQEVFHIVHTLLILFAIDGQYHCITVLAQISWYVEFNAPGSRESTPVPQTYLKTPVQTPRVQRTQGMIYPIALQLPVHIHPQHCIGQLKVFVLVLLASSYLYSSSVGHFFIQLPLQYCVWTSFFYTGKYPYSVHRLINLYLYYAYSSAGFFIRE